MGILWGGIVSLWNWKVIIGDEDGKLAQWKLVYGEYGKLI